MDVPAAVVFRPNYPNYDCGKASSNTISFDAHRKVGGSAGGVGARGVAQGRADRAALGGSAAAVFFVFAGAISRRFLREGGARLRGREMGGQGQEGDEEKGD